MFSYLAEHFDLPILDWIAEHLSCGFLDKVMPVITLLGDGGIFWIAVAVVMLIFKKTRKAGLSMGAALLMGLVVCNLIMKPGFARIRPYDYQLAVFGREIPLLIEAQHDFSFPSGHTIASFEGATALFLYSKKVGIPALVLACLIAFSRLYLYVHYPTDVLTSIVLGVAFGILGTLLVNKVWQLVDNRKKKPQ